MAESPRPPQSSASANPQGQGASNLRTVEVTEDSFGHAFKDLIPLPWRLFPVGRAWRMDLYLPRLRHTEEGDVLETFCFLPAGQILTQRQASALREAGLDYYYVPRSQMDQVVLFTGEQLKARLADHDLPLSEKAEAAYQHGSLLVEQAMGSEDLSGNLEQGRDYIQSLHGLVSQSPEAQRNLAKMLVMDYGLFTHSVNVCLLATGFASHLRLPERAVLDLGLGALYHDLGKRQIPESILKKPGPLDEREWEVMRRHPQEGHDLLARQDGFPPESRAVVHQHHENLDGSGYPQRLGSDALDLGPRLVRLIDSYDAITAVRAYKGARHAFEAIRIMAEEMREQVDLELLRDFVAFLGILAPSDGQLGRSDPSKQVKALGAAKPKGVRYTRGGRRIED